VAPKSNSWTWHQPPSRVPRTAGLRSEVAWWQRPPPPSSSGCRTRLSLDATCLFPRSSAWARPRRWRGGHISGTKITWQRSYDSRIALGCPPGVCFHCTSRERGLAEPSCGSTTTPSRPSYFKLLLKFVLDAHI
ncbi:unnamed protein product, partial [Ectocarpus sp. 8 AP-2014]